MNQAHREQQMRRALGRRLILVRGRMTQDAYAAQLGIHVNTLARYERGERLPGAEFLQRLGDNGVNLHWLLTGQVQQAHNAVQISEPQSVYAIQSFARVRASSGCTNPSHAPWLNKPVQRLGREECSEQPMPDKPAAKPAGEVDDLGAFLSQGSVLFFDPEWLQRNWQVSCEEVCLVAVQGDSMEPMLKAGDQVLVQRSCCCVEHDGLYLLALGQSLLVRRLQCLPGARYRVISANPAYASFMVKALDAVSLCHGIQESCNSHEQYFELETLPLGLVPDASPPWRDSVMALGATQDQTYLKARSQGDALRVLGRVLWVGQKVSV